MRVCAESLRTCLILCDPVGCSPPGSSVHGDSRGKNTGKGCRALLQGLFLTQGLNLHLSHLLHWWVGSLPLLPLGKHLFMLFVTLTRQPSGCHYPQSELSLKRSSVSRPRILPLIPKSISFPQGQEKGTREG